MNASKIAVAIFLAGAMIAIAIYIGLTQARREFMRSCLTQAAAFGNPAGQAEFLCSAQYSAKQ